MAAGPAIASVASQQSAAGQASLAGAGSTWATLTFVALTFGWTWSLWGISDLVRQDLPGLSKACVLAAGFGPSLAALFVVLTFAGVSGTIWWWHRCMAWRLRLRWYGVAFLAAPVAMLAALAIDGALGGSLPAPTGVRPFGAAVAQFALVLIIGGPAGEEFGWRGYALPVLTARLGWRWSSLIVGALWGVWHVPLFFMAGTGQSQMPMMLFLSSALALSIIFARLAMNTGFSVIPAILVHWSINSWSLVIPVIPTGGNIRPFALLMGLLFAAAAAAFLKPGPKLPAPV